MDKLQQRLLTRAEVAQLLSVEEKTLANWRSRSYGPRGFRVGKGVRYRREEVDRWLAEQEADTGGTAA